MAQQPKNPCERLLREQTSSWRNGKPVFVEEFQVRHPELGGNKEILAELIQNEFYSRLEMGHNPTIEGYLARFPRIPNLREELSLWLELRRQSNTEGKQPSFPSKYRIERELGEGAIACVFKAWSDNFEGPVAVKILKEGIDINEKDRQRMLNEAKILRELNQSNIVTVYDFGRIEDRPYVVLEWIEGGTLAESHEMLTPKRARTHIESRRCQHAIAKLIALVGGALDHTHGHGMFHGDIKPDNILLKPAKQSHAAAVEMSENTYVCPKLADFNLALAWNHDEPTAEAASRGSPPFLAPELLGKNLDGERRTDQRTEVYSLGMILFQLLTGLATKELHHPTRRTPLSPKSYDPNLDAELCEICERCLAFNPNRRYQTVAELVKTLQAYLDGGVQGLFNKVHARIRSLRWAVLAGGLALAFLIPIVVYTAPRPEVAKVTVMPPEASGRPTEDPISAAKKKRIEDLRKRFLSGEPLTNSELVEWFASHVNESLESPKPGLSEEKLRERLEWLLIQYQALLRRLEGDKTNGANLRFNMGLAYYYFSEIFPDNSSKWREAKEKACGYYHLAKTLDEKCARAFNNLAHTRIQLGNAASVVEYARRAVELTDPSDKSLYAERTDTLLQAYVLQARDRGGWCETNRKVAVQTAEYLIERLQAVDKRARAQAVQGVILPQLQSGKVPTVVEMRAIQSEQPFFQRRTVRYPMKQFVIDAVALSFAAFLVVPEAGVVEVGLACRQHVQPVGSQKCFVKIGNESMEGRFHPDRLQKRMKEKVTGGSGRFSLAAVIDGNESMIGEQMDMKRLLQLNRKGNESMIQRTRPRLSSIRLF